MAKYIGLGCVVQVDPAGATTYVTIDQIVSFTPPQRERELVDGTSLDDTLQTYIPGIEKHSNCEINFIWDPDDADHTALYTLFGSKAEAQWKLTYTDATPSTWTFKGKVSNFNLENVEHNKTLMAKITIQRTNAITVA